MPAARSRRRFRLDRRTGRREVLPGIRGMRRVRWAHDEASRHFPRAPDGASGSGHAVASREDDMPLKVIGAGLGRTGTLSLKMALEELGFVKCYHMIELLANMEQVRRGISPLGASPSIGMPSSRDTRRPSIGPAATSMRSCCADTPRRRSCSPSGTPSVGTTAPRQTIYYVRQAFPRWIRLFSPRMRQFHRMLDRLVWDGMFQGRFEDRAFAIEVFNRYNEQVRRDLPPDRLLIFEAREGWEPLCAFLGVPVPEGKPFPHVNDTAEFRARIQRVSRIMRAVGYTVVAVVALLLVWLAGWLL